MEKGEIRAGRAYIKDAPRLAKVWRIVRAVATGRAALEIGLRVRRADGKQQ